MAGPYQYSWQPGAAARARGLGIMLRSMVPADIDDSFAAQLRDPEVSRNLDLGRGAQGITRQRLINGLAAYDNRRKFLVGIWPVDGSRLLGFCTAKITPRNSTALITVAITEKQQWSRRAGTIATLLLRGFLFDAVKVHKIAAHVYAENTGTIDLALRLGWTREGQLRQAEPDGKGGWRDIVLIGIFRDEHGKVPDPEPYAPPR
jgi:RimJ/RimL family protein N-acetyltransferase